MGGQVTGRKRRSGARTTNRAVFLFLFLHSSRFPVSCQERPRRKEIPFKTGLTKRMARVIIRLFEKEGLLYETLHCNSSCNGTGETLHGAYRIRNSYPASPAYSVKSGMEYHALFCCAVCRGACIERPRTMLRPRPFCAVFCAGGGRLPAPFKFHRLGVNQYGTGFYFWKRA